MLWLLLILAPLVALLVLAPKLVVAGTLPRRDAWGAAPHPLPRSVHRCKASNEG
ncbi:hypothetical protein [Pyrolobus fumarii]|uniref:hypothetical protein n=1 Tax=Pyrolobus fumarii TaxID=54252 RepID=UPI001432C7A8|nr:hypothetical protein [Pyrolobus fumarii]